MIDINPETVIIAKKLITTVFVLYGTYIANRIFQLFSKAFK